MDGLLTLLGPLGAPVSFVGFLLFMYAYMRKQEAQVNADLKQTIDRQKKDLDDYAKESDTDNERIQKLREENAVLIVDKAILEAKVRSYEITDLRGE